MQGMARKDYADEFRQRAVDLFESTAGATLKGIAVELGISRGTLKDWVDRLGTGTTTASTASSGPGARPGSQTVRVVRLEAENAALRAEAVKLQTERDILRQAAKYFAEETNW